MIRFVENSPTDTTVFLDGKEVGRIHKVGNGWSYFPKGQKKGGEVFKSLAACKFSLRDD